MGSVSASHQLVSEPELAFDLVLNLLHKHDFAVLATVDGKGEPHAAGVNYGLSASEGDLTLYVMTRRNLRKARNIAQNPGVSLVIPVTRKVMWFLPPPTIQLRGVAEILDWTNPEGTAVFRRFWMGRRILAAYNESYRRGETRICFLKITPDPVITTYMVGYSVWSLRNRMESGAAKVVIPPTYRASSHASST